MTFYRVKEKYDQRKRADGSILVGNELYTRKELEANDIPSQCVEEVKLSPRKTYWCFGARFAV